MKKYLDPQNADIIKNKITEIPNLKEIIDILNDVFPSWIKGLIIDYSDDYPSLKKNWLEICDKINTKPQQIVLVEFLSIEKDYSLLNFFCNILTFSGFVIRTYDQFFPCRICSKAIPSFELYTLLKNNNENIPEVWRNTCEKCI